MPAIFSALRRGLCLSSNLSAAKGCQVITQRAMGGGPRTMHITPSRWQWHKFKDMFHFYVMLGAIPIGLMVTYINVFVGPARLAPIPEDYTPKPHEFYEHPITRWICKHFTRTYQEEYEKRLHILYVSDDAFQMKKIERKILDTIKEKQDVRGYTFVPAITKYHKRVREEFEEIPHTRGRN